MGSDQSTNTTSEIKELPQAEEAPSCSDGGRKESAVVLVEEPLMISVESLEETESVVSSSDETYESEDDSEDEEDEEWNERLAILQDVRNLRKAAEFYFCPEKPVETDGFCQGRNYFTRFDAPNSEMADEKAQILADAAALKKFAVDYLCPEQPVVSIDPISFGRNYFSRISAEEYDDVVTSLERQQILQDMKEMKKLAVDYLHPELPVKTSDPCATGRSYFSRPSAAPYDDDDEAQERERILADAAALKKFAVDYLHPEVPVRTTDPFATGRNYFSRFSAEEQEDEDAADDRDEILDDMAELKRLAQDYLCPERPVDIDPSLCGRNYFSRISAEEYDDVVTSLERQQILQDMKEMKKLAVDYLHPELPVKTSDQCATGRSYFSRPSAAPYDDDDEAQERERILADAAALKKFAVDYLHPEVPVRTTDPFATGRNYFSRFSAEEQEDEDAADDRDEILDDMAELKRLAQDYLCPERPVDIDPSLCGRNYFSRISAEEYDDVVTSLERQQILQDMKEMKKLAVDYLHPELPVKTSDQCATGRSYFSRPSAAPYDDDEAQERERILADAAALKKFAVDYLHPEVPVRTTDPFATGRNYFSRTSAFSGEEASERDRVLDDMAALKKHAVDYLHPELPVKTEDANAMGRNYFDRASAPGHVELVRSEGYVLSSAASDDRHQYYHYHVDNHMHHDHHEQSDHFEMDEDMANDFQEFRQSLQMLASSPIGSSKVLTEEEEGRLSRSPSSVMLDLFGEEPAM